VTLQRLLQERATLKFYLKHSLESMGNTMLSFFVTMGDTMQKVYKSRTQSGVIGYFTNGFLVIPLTEEEYNMTDAEHTEYAKARGWLYVAR